MKYQPFTFGRITSQKFNSIEEAYFSYTSIEIIKEQKKDSSLYRRTLMTLYQSVTGKDYDPYNPLIPLFKRDYEEYYKSLKVLEYWEGLKENE